MQETNKQTNSTPTHVQLQPLLQLPMLSPVALHRISFAKKASVLSDSLKQEIFQDAKSGNSKLVSDCRVDRVREEERWSLETSLVTTFACFAQFARKWIDFFWRKEGLLEDCDRWKQTRKRRRVVFLQMNDKGGDAHTNHFHINIVHQVVLISMQLHFQNS